MLSEVNDSKKVKPIITGLYSGTVYDDNLCEIVTEFNKGIIGKEYQGAQSSDWNHLHLYGPGSLKQHKFTSPLRRVFDILQGYSMKKNVNKTIEALQSKFKSDDEFVFNMAGWSRGAVTCIATANAIKNKFPKAKINMFLIDPVPGAYNHTPDKLSIPDNVDHLIVNYAQGEIGLRSKLLKPANLIITDKNTQVEVIRTAGLHYSGVDHFWANHLDEPDLVWGSLYQFLEEHGVALDASKIKQHYKQDNKTGMIDFVPKKPAELIELSYSNSEKIPKKKPLRGLVSMIKNRSFTRLNTKVRSPFVDAFQKRQLEKHFPVLHELFTLPLDEKEAVNTFFSDKLPILEKEIISLQKAGCAKTLDHFHIWLAKHANAFDLQQFSQLNHLFLLPVNNPTANKQFPKTMYESKFMNEFNTLWVRPMDIISDREYLTGMLSLSNSYLSSTSLMRSHRGFFKNLTQLVDKYIEYNYLKTTEQESQIIDNLMSLLKNQLAKPNMNKQGHCYNMCLYMLTRLEIAKSLLLKDDEKPKPAQDQATIKFAIPLTTSNEVVTLDVKKIINNDNKIEQNERPNLFSLFKTESNKSNYTNDEKTSPPSQPHQKK